MNFISRLYCRIVQKTIFSAMHFLSFPIPTSHQSYDDVILCLNKKGKKKPLIVSGKHVSQKKEVQDLIQLLKENDFDVDIYTEITSDPQTESIEKLFDFFIKNHFDSIIAIGGGSVIDACKALQVKLLYPNQLLIKKRGILKIKKKPCYLFCIPTTAGTGSEATACTVISDKKDKFAISDPVLIPEDVLLDAHLLKGQRKENIAYTGMDAFCHALESYLSLDRTKFIYEKSLLAMKKIKDNLYDYYQDENRIECGRNLLNASFYAGVSFTRAYVGYVHALAHAIGGEYHLPHGYCIAILLPYVLLSYQDKANKRLATLAKELSIVPCDSSNIKENADKMIQFIFNLNKKLNIPSTFEHKISPNDYSKLALHATKEANPLYPVIKELSKDELKEIIRISNEGK